MIWPSPARFESKLIRKEQYESEDSGICFHYSSNQSTEGSSGPQSVLLQLGHRLLTCAIDCDMRCPRLSRVHVLWGFRVSGVEFTDFLGLWVS